MREPDRTDRPRRTAPVDTVHHGRVAFAIAAAVLLILSACTADDDGRSVPAGELHPDQTLRINTFRQPESFDPGQQESITESSLGRQYAEALLKVGPDGEDVVGAAAEGFEVSSDGLVYTFHLRPEAGYNDGEPVRARDFVHAWRRLVDPRLAAPLGGLFARVIDGGEAAASLGPEASPERIDAALEELGFEAVDDRTFRVHLEEPAPYFRWLATLWVGAPIRPDVVERHGSERWANRPETLVTNGPFQVSEVVFGESITLEANPHHWDPPRLDRIVAHQLDGPLIRWTRYLNGELDISNGPPLQSYRAALEEHSDELIRYLEPSVAWIQFNTDRAPFDDPDVRRAFSHAVDREGFAADAMFDLVEPRATLVPEGVPGHAPELADVQAFDPSRARELLEAAGGPEELGEVRLLSLGDPEVVVLADRLSDVLGVEVRVDPTGDAATVESRLNEGDYDMFVLFSVARYPDPQPFFDRFRSDSPNNTTGWEDPDYDRHLDEAETTPDGEDRLARYRRAHEVLLREAPVVPLVQFHRFFFVKPWVRGIQSTPFDDPSFAGSLYSTNIWIADH